MTFPPFSSSLSLSQPSSPALLGVVPFISPVSGGSSPISQELSSTPGGSPAQSSPLVPHQEVDLTRGGMTSFCIGNEEEMTVPNQLLCAFFKGFKREQDEISGGSRLGDYAISQELGRNIQNFVLGSVSHSPRSVDELIKLGDQIKAALRKGTSISLDLFLDMKVLGDTDYMWDTALKDFPWSQIRLLKVEGHSFSGRDAMSLNLIKGLGECNSIEILRLEGGSIDESIVTKMAETLAGLVNLKALSFANNQIESGAFTEILTGISALNGLMEADLSGLGLGKRDVRGILDNLKKLQRLNVSDNNFSYNDLQEIALGLTQLKSFKAIDNALSRGQRSQLFNTLKMLLLEASNYSL